MLIALHAAVACVCSTPNILLDMSPADGEPGVPTTSEWQPSVGVATVYFLADVRNLQLGVGGAVALKPAIQFAEVRADRPGAGAASTAGAVITAVGLTHFAETLSASSQCFFRRSWSYKLTAGSFARVSLLQYTSYRGGGKVFAPREIVMNPTNSTDDVSYFSTTGPFAAVGVYQWAELALAVREQTNGDPNSRCTFQIIPAITYV